MADYCYMEFIFHYLMALHCMNLSHFMESMHVSDSENQRDSLLLNSQNLFEYWMLILVILSNLKNLNGYLIFQLLEFFH